MISMTWCARWLRLSLLPCSFLVTLSIISHNIWLLGSLIFALCFFVYFLQLSVAPPRWPGIFFFHFGHMVLQKILPALLLTLSTRVTAAPIFGIGQTDSNTAVSTLSTDQTNVFIKPARWTQPPWTHDTVLTDLHAPRFSQIAYCSPQAILSWNCGAPCAALPGIEPLVTGGGIILIVRHQYCDSLPEIWNRWWSCSSV